MQKTVSSPLRSLTNTQWVLLAAAFVVLAFLIAGSFSQASVTEPDPLFGRQPFVVLAFLAFAGGLLSFVSPCTLPILTAYFAFAFQSGRTQIAANTVSFMLGLATTFSIFGAGAFALGAVLYQNQQLILLIGGSLVVLFGVMSLQGRGFGGVQAANQTERSTTLGGSYLFGLTFAVGWSSCVGPILGTVLTLAAQTTSVSRGMMLLFIYALGLGVPLIIVSTFFGRTSRQSLFWRVLRGKGTTWHAHAGIIVVWVIAAWVIVTAVIQYLFLRLPQLAGRQFTDVQQYGLLLFLLIATALYIYSQPFGEGGEISKRERLLSRWPVALIWALAGWRILVAILPALGGPLEYALFLLPLALAAVWVYTGRGNRRVEVELHSTQLISGAMFIILGILMLNGRLAAFNDLIPPELAEWLAIQEERLIDLFN